MSCLLSAVKLKGIGRLCPSFCLSVCQFFSSWTIWFIKKCMRIISQMQSINFYYLIDSKSWLCKDLQSGILLGWLTNFCTQPSEVWHLCKWHLLICIFDFSTVRHLKWVKTTNFQISRDATRLSATNQHSSKWYPRLISFLNAEEKHFQNITHIGHRNEWELQMNKSAKIAVLGKEEGNSNSNPKAVISLWPNSTQYPDPSFHWHAVWGNNTVHLLHNPVHH